MIRTAMMHSFVAPNPNKNIGFFIIENRRLKLGCILLSYCFRQGFIPHHTNRRQLWPQHRNATQTRSSSNRKLIFDMVQSSFHTRGWKTYVNTKGTLQSSPISSQAKFYRNQLITHLNKTPSASWDTIGMDNIEFGGINVLPISPSWVPLYQLKCIFLNEQMFNSQ